MKTSKVSKPVKTVKGLVSDEMIEAMAYQISQSNDNVNPVENWLKAEKILKS